MQADPRWTPTLSTFFRENLVMKYSYEHSSFSADLRRADVSCSERMYTGKLPPGSLSMKSAVRITDHPGLTYLFNNTHARIVN